jgi:hypothetical protein
MKATNMNTHSRTVVLDLIGDPPFVLLHAGVGLPAPQAVTGAAERQAALRRFFDFFQQSPFIMHPSPRISRDYDSMVIQQDTCVNGRN